MDSLAKILLLFMSLFLCLVCLMQKVGFLVVYKGFFPLARIVGPQVPIIVS